MSTEKELQPYFEQAASWEADRVAEQRRRTRIAHWAAAAGWLCASASGLALVLLLPLKRVEPYVIRVDSTTGLVDVVPSLAANARVPDTVTRYLLTHYVTVCERFNFSTAESDYEECGAFHTTQRNQAWYAHWTRTNPDSPLNVHQDGSSVRVQVTSVSFFPRANGVADLAQVRYWKAQQAAGGSNEQVSYWIATLQYAYAKPSEDPRVRQWNPLGFKVVDFKPEREAVSR